MKHAKRTVTRVLTILLMIACLSPVPAEAKQKTLTYAKKLTVKVGSSKKVKIQKAKGMKMKKITFQSSNKKIATVNKKGLVKGKKAGSCKVKVTAKYKYQKMMVTQKFEILVKVKQKTVAPNYESLPNTEEDTEEESDTEEENDTEIPDEEISPSITANTEEKYNAVAAMKNEMTSVMEDLKTLDTSDYTSEQLTAYHNLLNNTQTFLDYLNEVDADEVNMAELSNVSQSITSSMKTIVNNSSASSPTAKPTATSKEDVDASVKRVSEQLEVLSNDKASAEEKKKAITALKSETPSLVTDLKTLDTSDCTPEQRTAYQNLLGNMQDLMEYLDEADTNEVNTSHPTPIPDAANHQHKYNFGIVLHKATCTEPGTLIRTCNLCSQQKSEVIPATGHKPVSKTAPATCTQTGSIVSTCANDGCTYRQETVLPAIGHDLASKTAEATCTQKGATVSTCTREGCNYTATKVLNPLGHNLEVVRIPATCEKAGSVVSTCERDGCEYEDIQTVNPTGHNYALTYTVDKEATCGEAGSKSQHCGNCSSKINAVEIPATGHNYGEWIIAQDANTITKGMKYRTCSKCKAQEKETIEVYKPFTLTANNYTKAGIQRTGDVVIPKTFNYNGSRYLVTNIGDKAFYECVDITSVTIPDSVITIGNNAFSGCINMTRIGIPDSVTTIGDYAFNFTKKLTKITIPDSVVKIGEYAFAYTEKLTSLTIPDSVIIIGDYAFQYCNINRIDIPDSVISIGEGAFFGCDALTKVTLSNCLTTLEPLTFCCCTALPSIEIPNSVVNIQHNAFANCQKLSNVIIPESVTEIVSNVFTACPSLTSVTFHDTSGWFTGSNQGEKTTQISSTNLANSSTAATYLRETYRGCWWAKE